MNINKLRDILVNNLKKVLTNKKALAALGIIRITALIYLGTRPDPSQKELTKPIRELLKILNESTPD